MNILVILFPLALGLGLAGLLAFFWCMRTGQFADLEGPSWRVLQDDDIRRPPDQPAETPGPSTDRP
jgi:cbb3-type cytochrome oxidase maturation protein